MVRLIISLLLLSCLSLNAQQYIGSDGEITFFSEAPLENISAINKKVSAVYDNDTKDIVFQLFIKDFISDDEAEVCDTFSVALSPDSPVSRLTS